MTEYLWCRVHNRRIAENHPGGSLLHFVGELAKVAAHTIDSHPTENGMTYVEWGEVRNE